MVLLTAAALPLLSLTPSRGAAGFAKMARAVWVWKDRVLDPGELPLFCERLQIGVLFVPVIAPVRLPDHLALAGRAVSAGLFDGLHLDVEPHALAAWRDPSSRLPLFEHAPALCHRGAQVYLAGSLRSPLPWKLAT